MKITITGQNAIAEAKAIVAGQSEQVKAVINYEDGTVRDARLVISSNDELMMLAKGRRRYGYELWRTCRDHGEIKAIILTIPDRITPAQAYVKDLRRLQDYVRKHGDPRLWDDYRAKLEAITDDKIAQLEQTDCASHYEAWKLAGEIGLPRIEGFKTLTLKSCKAPVYVIEGIRKALGREAFAYAWRGSYDYSVSGKRCDDGVYRAWLSAEYRGMGNGHYYLLIDAEHAIFCEDD